jgi:preprotein translocase subunit Sss1
MKIQTDEQLSNLHKYTFGKSKALGYSVADAVIKHFEDLFHTDEKFGQLDYSGALSSIMKSASIIFLKLIEFAHHVATHFPDAETNFPELLEECISGLRVLADVKEPDKKEYIGGIKKVGIN